MKKVCDDHKILSFNVLRVSGRNEHIIPDLSIKDQQRYSACSFLSIAFPFFGGNLIRKDFLGLPPIIYFFVPFFCLFFSSLTLVKRNGVWSRIRVRLDDNNKGLKIENNNIHKMACVVKNIRSSTLT